MARVGMASRAECVARNGFHPSGIFGGFGAASVAAKLFRLSQDQILSAWGLVLSSASGSMQFSEEADTSAVKQLHLAHAAQAGMTAAELVIHGIQGPRHAIAGRYGICRLFSDNPNFEQLDRPLFAPLQIHDVVIKLYPSCRMCHAAIDALRQCTDDFSLSWKMVRRIRIFGPAKLLSQHMQRRPRSMSAAQYSLPYTIAAAIRFGGESIEPFFDVNLDDQNTLDLVDKVDVLTDACFDAAFPAHIGSKVELHLIDGTMRRAAILDSRGTIANPALDEDFTNKFSNLMMQATVEQSQIEKIQAETQALPYANDLSGLLSALRFLRGESGAPP